MPDSPLTVRGAAIVQVAEAVVVLAATVLAGVDAASGKSYRVDSGIALTVIGALSAVALAWIAWGLAQVRPWSRTPALLTQLFFGIVGIYLLQGRRYDWGTASVVLAVLGFAALLAPASFRVLASQRAQPGGQATSKREPAAAESKQPAAKAKQPAGASKQPAAKAKQPAGASKQPAAGGKQPAGGKQSAPAPGRKRSAR